MLSKIRSRAHRVLRVPFIVSVLFSLLACGDGEKSGGSNPAGLSSAPSTEDVALQQEQAESSTRAAAANLRQPQATFRGETPSSTMSHHPSSTVRSNVVPTGLNVRPTQLIESPVVHSQPPALVPFVPAVVAEPAQFEQFSTEFRLNPDPYAYIGWTQGPVIAIGDLHGDLQIAISALLAVQVIALNPQDNAFHWNPLAVNVVVVQTGDQIDRGDYDRRLLVFLDQLQREAVRYSSHLIVLNGNHELMNTSGQMDYVTLDAFMEFADLNVPDSFFNGNQLVNVDLITTLTNLFLPDFIRNHADGLYLPIHSPQRPAYQRRANNITDAIANRAWAFAPGGPMALGMARRSFFAIVNRTLYVHGGMTVPALDGSFASGEAQIQITSRTAPSEREGAERRAAARIGSVALTNYLPPMTPVQHLKRLNQLMRGWLNKETRYSRATVLEVMRTQRSVTRTVPGTSTSVEVTVEAVTQLLQGGPNSGYLTDGLNLIEIDDPSNPFWDRTFSRQESPPSDADCRTLFARLEHDLGVVEMVVGHSIQNSIRTVCDNRLWLIDVALSRGYANQHGQQWQPQILYRHNPASLPQVVNFPLAAYFHAH